MIWNYRVTHRPVTAPLEGYMIREVYYDDAGSVALYSKDPITAYGCIPDELYEEHCHMMKAFDREPLNLDHTDYLLGKKKRKKSEKKDNRTK